MNYDRYEQALTCKIPTDSTDVKWLINGLPVMELQSCMDYYTHKTQYGISLKLVQQCSLNVELILTNNTRNYELQWMRGNESRSHVFDMITTRTSYIDRYEGDIFETSCMDNRIFYRHNDDNVWQSIKIDNFTLKITNLNNNVNGIYACPADEFRNIVVLTILPKELHTTTTTTTTVQPLPDTLDIPTCSNTGWILFISYFIFTLLVLMIWIICRIDYTDIQKLYFAD
jgi:hypothetical protein